MDDIRDDMLKASKKGKGIVLVVKPVSYMAIIILTVTTNLVHGMSHTL